MYIQIFVALLVLSPTVNPAAAQDDVGKTEDTELRLTRLEALAGRIKIGGWLDFIYFNSTKDGQDDLFNVQHVYLNFDVKVSEHWLAFVEIEYENIPEIGDFEEQSGRVVLDRGYIEYKYHAAARLRMGKFNTPAGIWKPLHWAVTTDTTLEPIMESSDYIPTKSLGMEFLGTRYTARGALDYAVLVSNGGESSNTAESSDDANGIGADIRYSLGERAMAGVSFHQLDNDRTPEVGTFNGFMAYAEGDVIPRKLLLRAEYLFLNRSNRNDAQSFYIKAKWQFHEKWYANLRYDFAEDEMLGTDAEQINHVLTLGYRPHPHVRLKFEAADIRYENRDESNVHQWSGWIGLIF